MTNSTERREEIWKPVVGHEEHYSISNFGNVRREMSYRGGLAGKILKLFITHKGYLRCSLYMNNKRINGNVHKMVAKAFIPNPMNKVTINHKDMNKLNNHVDNLEWSTNLENIRHANKNGAYENCYASMRGRPIIWMEKKRLSKKISMLQVMYFLGKS